MGRVIRGDLAPKLKLSAHLRANMTLVMGGAATAVGAGLIYLPGGVILGGLLTIAFGLLAVDIDRKGQ